MSLSTRERRLLALLVAVCLVAMAACSPGYYRSRQFNDLSRSPSTCPSTIYKR